MAVLLKILVVDYHVALFAFTVIFLILFLLYRERCQQPSVTDDSGKPARSNPILQKSISSSLSLPGSPKADEHTHNVNLYVEESKGSLRHRKRETKMSDHPVQKCNIYSPTQPFTFAVDKRGCQIVSPYCKLDIPPGATLEPQTITMKPSYNEKPRSLNEVLVTPYVDFKTQNGCEPKFIKDVTLALHTGYSAVNGEKGVSVKILCKKNSASTFVFVGKAVLRQNKFISFKCRHLGGHSIAADQSHFTSMRRNYYYAGYVKASQRTTTHIFHWMLFEDCPLSLEQNKKYLDTNLDGVKVIDPEPFYIEYDYGIQLVILRVSIGAAQYECRNVQLSHYWGSRVCVSNKFPLKNDSGRSYAYPRIEYQMFAVHNQNDSLRLIRKKEFYYKFKDFPVKPAATIDVYGSSSCGTSRTDSGFTEQDEPFTFPGAMSGSPVPGPKPHSTPRHSPVPQDVYYRMYDPAKGSLTEKTMPSLVAPTEFATIGSGDVGEEPEDRLSTEMEATLDECFGRKATKSATIGSSGGEIELCGCRVIFPRNAVKRDTKFGASVDNSPENFPKDRMAITSILSVEPPTEFNEAVSVKMRTWYGTVKGKKLTSQIHRKEEGREWEFDQEVTLSDKNEISFDVWNFCKVTATISEGSDVDLVPHILNCVYMHRGTGVITSVFSKESLGLDEARNEIKKHGHEQVLPTTKEIRCTSQSVFRMKIECINPKDATYISRSGPLTDTPALFIVAHVLKKKFDSCYFRAQNFPSQCEGSFEAEYLIDIENGMKEQDNIYAILCSSKPAVTKNKDGGNVRIAVNQKENLYAVKAAIKGGKFSNEEHGVHDSLIVKHEKDD